MPNETPNPVPEQPHDDWQQLAHDAREHWDLDHPGVAALYEQHVVPKLHDKGLGHLAITSEEKAGGRFLHKYGTVDQKEVSHVIGYMRQNGETIPDKAGDRTTAYLKFMADTVDDGILTGDPESVSRQIDAHVIKAEDVPKSYFALQRRIAREQGHGDVEVTPDMKRQLIEAAQADQRAALTSGLSILVVMTAATQIGSNAIRGIRFSSLARTTKKKSSLPTRYHNRRSIPGTQPRALAYAYDTVKKFHVLDEKVDDAKLTQILKEGSFGPSLHPCYH
ncbi:unnamed protein product [Sphagnum jensenii]|uniref:Uncharacterized protein n=1 Tax=Sphagnum jensenii TaxID=128206 RepID=A0ABP0VE97_9BRYO